MGRQPLWLVFGSFCAVSPVAAQTVQFSAAQIIQTNAKHLTGLAVADFNGDGKPDIAVTDDFSQTVSVYLNDGTGKFGTPVTSTFNVPSIGGFGAIVAGDINEDGKQDLIVGPIAGLQYDVVLLGNGDGTFTEKGQIAGSYGFFDASLIDINGDKHLDLVAGGNGSLYVHLGDGQGNFTKQPLMSPLGGQEYFGITVGDFNGDKKPDFLATWYNNNAMIFYPGNGDGSFGTSSTIPFAASPMSVASADFNGDGKLDLLVGSADIASVIFGNGDGTFQTNAAITLPLPATSGLNVSPIVATADMDGNGTTDVVAEDNGSGYLNVLLNDGTGKFSQSKPDFDVYIGGSTGALKLGDLNGDGLPDIVLIDNSTQKISIFLSVIPKTTPTVSIQSSAAQALVGSTVTITVQVKPSGSRTPSGTVTLTSGSTSYGQQNLNSSGQASFTLPSLAVGQYALTASYSGDTYNNSASNSTAFTQNSTDFQISLSSSTQTVGIGAAATYNVNLTPEAGFTGPISFSCTGLPAVYTCAAQSVSINGQAVTAALVVSPPTTTSERPIAPFLFHPGATTFFALTGLCFYSRRRQIGRLLVCVALLGAFTAVSGCSNSSPKPSGYTGTSNFAITAAATQGGVTVSHQVSATLTVQ